MDGVADRIGHFRQVREVRVRIDGVYGGGLSRTDMGDRVVVFYVDFSSKKNT